VAAFIDRKLPHPLQTFAALYGTWLEQLRAAPARKTAAAKTRRWVKLLVLDVALLSALVIGTAVSLETIAESASTTLGVSERLARGLVVLGAAAIAVPFLTGIIRITHRLGLALAQVALPAATPGKLDLAETPRRALVVTLQLAVMVLVGLPMAALTQPFLPGWAAGLSLGLLLVVLGFVLWRRATNLQGHVKAGAEMIVEALVTRAGRRPAAPDEEALDQIKQLMPGLGELVPVRLDGRSAAVGKTLAQLHLRGITGASVLAIARGDQGVIVPMAGEVLHAGDVLALAGTRDALAAATEVLTRPAPRGEQDHGAAPGSVVT
jgi:CPA2 family monovalent cation:H+ antiporter-2